MRESLFAAVNAAPAAARRLAAFGTRAAARLEWHLRNRPTAEHPKIHG